MTQFSTLLAAEEQKLLACVHCGLCLDACPTYVLTGDENDSPRGRIYLMRAVEEGKLAADSRSFKLHIDRCLGCRACEPVCPAGVEYGHLLEESRAELFAPEISRNLMFRILRLVLAHVLLHPRRLRLAFSFARLLRWSRIPGVLLKLRITGLISPRLEFALALLESSRRPTNFRLSPPRSSSLQDPGNASSTNLGFSHTNLSDKPVSLFLGCVGEGLFARINRATARVLETNGFRITAPKEQGCCGALHAHAGDLEGAQILARRNIEAFEDQPDNAIITNAGGCGAMLAGYEHLLSGDEPFRERARNFSARIRDVSQQLEEIEIKQGAALDSGRITYDASCHLINGQHAGNAPLRMLKAIPNFEFVPLEGADRCCGAAGVYNLVEPEMSRGVLKEKLANVRSTGACILTTGNAGCQMQIGAGAKLDGLSLQVCHPVELLDESYERAAFYS